jgi:hypothetical protein
VEYDWSAVGVLTIVSSLQRFQEKNEFFCKQD